MKCNNEASETIAVATLKELAREMNNLFDNRLEHVLFHLEDGVSLLTEQRYDSDEQIKRAVLAASTMNIFKNLIIIIQQENLHKLTRT